MAKSKKNDEISHKKEDFIDFLSSMTPEEINQLIIEKGKPRKLIEPIIFPRRLKSG